MVCELWPIGFGLVSFCMFLCLFLPRASLFVMVTFVVLVLVYYLVLLWLSVPAQLIGWKDSSPK